MKQNSLISCFVEYILNNFTFYRYSKYDVYCISENDCVYALQKRENDIHDFFFMHIIGL